MNDGDGAHGARSFYKHSKAPTGQGRNMTNATDKATRFNTITRDDLEDAWIEDPRLVEALQTMEPDHLHTVGSLGEYLPIGEVADPQDAVDQWEETRRDDQIIRYVDASNNR